MSDPRSRLGDGEEVLGLGEEVLGLGEEVVSWTVCSKVVTPAVLSWARAGFVMIDVSRLVSCHATHSKGGAAITRAKISAFVAGISHRTMRYLLVGPATHSKRERLRGPAAGAMFGVSRGETSLKLDQDAADNATVSEVEREPQPLRNGVVGDADLSFAVFSLAHAECGEEGAIELRLDEHSLLVWCPSCASLETFGSPA
jgi:hypothetical protein